MNNVQANNPNGSADWLCMIDEGNPQGQWYNSKVRPVSPDLVSVTCNQTIAIQVDYNNVSGSEKTTDHLHVTAQWYVDGTMRQIGPGTNKPVDTPNNLNSLQCADQQSLLQGIRLGDACWQNQGQPLPPGQQQLPMTFAHAWCAYTTVQDPNGESYQRINKWTFTYTPDTPPQTTKQVIFTVDYGDPQLRTTKPITVPAQTKE